MNAGNRSVEKGWTRLDPTDQRWLAYVASKPEAMVFHHPAWMQVLAQCYGHRAFVVAVHDDAGNIVAGLPMLDVRSLITGRRWVSLPFTDFCPPLYDDAASRDRLADSLVSLHADHAAPRIEVRWQLPARSGISAGAPFVLHVLNLDADPDRVRGGLKRQHLQNIRAAEKHGVRIVWGKEPDDMRLFYRLHTETRQRLGVPVQPWRFFKLLQSQVLEQGLGFLLFAYHGDTVLATGLFLHWQKSITYKYAASTQVAQDLRPNNLLTWEAISWACEHGLTQFDWGRSDLENEGLRRYKRGWGAEEIPLVYSTLPAAPSRQVDGRASELLHRVITKSPAWVCRATGELLYRHFG